MSTTAAVFTHEYGRALKQRGFVSADEANTLYAKMTGNETVGIIALLPQDGLLPSVYCGAATLYCRDLDPAFWQDQIPIWMHTLDYFYHAHYPDTWTRETMDSLSGSITDHPQQAAADAFQWTDRLVLPLLERACDLSSTVDFLIRYGKSVTQCDNNDTSPLTEDLLCVRAGYQGDFLETLLTRREYTQHRQSDAERGMDSDGPPYTDYAVRKKEDAAKLKQQLVRILQDPDRLKHALAECEQRRIRNLSHLRRAGILLDSPQT